MRYKFLCAIHYLSLEKERTHIDLPIGFISNDKQIFAELFKNNLSLFTLGVHSIDEIQDAPSYYMIEGDLGDQFTQSNIDIYGTALCFFYLRQIQCFLDDIWNIKDNSIYVRDAFLYTYSNNVSDGCTFKASVTAINSLSTGIIEQTVVSTEDLVRLAKEMEIFEFDINPNKSQDYKYATQIQHYKKSKIDRKQLAIVYVRMARSQAIIPMKLLMYSSALEALVATSTTELSHRVAERVAILLGNTPVERCSIYNDIKNGYDVRSKVAHGDLIKKDENKITEYSLKIDEYLRQLLRLDSPFNLSDNEIDYYFLNKLMS